MITGNNEKFKVIPLKGIPEQQISSSFFTNRYKFGVCFGEPNTGPDGKMIFRCDIYKAEVDTAIEIDGGKKVYQVRNYLREQLYPKETKTFNESEIIRGFLTKTMRGLLEVVGLGTKVGTHESTTEQTSVPKVGSASSAEDIIGKKNLVIVRRGIREGK